MNLYLLFKSLHLIAVISWMVGLLYLPRIFVYHVENIEKKGIIIVPVAFVSEHSETLVELDIEYKKLAEKNGCAFYKRVPALGVEENFIKGLATLVLQQETRGNFVSSIMCSNKYVKCPCLGL